MAVIELGLRTAEADEFSPDAGPSPLRRWQRRRLLIAAVAACCLLTVTGSARPGPSALPRLWSAPFTAEADTFRLIGGSVYQLSQQTDGRLTARDARTGRVRWTFTGVDDFSWITAVAGGALLMPTGTASRTQREPDGSSSTFQFSRDTMALDTATGRPLWRERGEFVAVVGDRALLSEWDETGQRSRGLRLVRLRDGGTVWARARGDLAYWAIDTTPGGSADRVVTVTPQGLTEVIATADGTVVTTGQLPWTERAQENDYSMVSVLGRRLYLDQTVRDKSSISAYETDTLRRLWRVGQSTSGGSYGCGPVVCVTDGETTAGHDRETGEQRWRLIGAANGYPLPGNRLVLDDDGGARRILIDGTTGRRLADLGSAMPVRDSWGRGTPYLLNPTTKPAGLTAVSTLDPRSGQVRLRGAIPAVVDYACQHEGDLLACGTPDNRLAVTDVG